jgi:mono/diheme cytochrome c family protein
VRRAIVCLAGLALVAALAGCGSEGQTKALPETVVGTIQTTAATTQTSPASTLKGDPAKGKAVFASAGCGGCHTLADAGSTGNVGPNLDQAKPADELVKTRVWFGKGAMPAFGKQGQLSPQQVADVAAYVSSAAGS